MTAVIANETPEQEVSNVHASRNSRGLAKVLGLSALVMVMALPIGFYPRVLQSGELNKQHEIAAARLPEVSVSKAVVAPSTRQISLPGNIEAVVETGIYARRDGYIRHRYVDIGDSVKAGQVLAEIETPEIDETTNEAKVVVLTNIAGKEQAQASLEKAKADVVTATADLAQAQATLVQNQSNEGFAAKSYQRWKLLVKEGAVSYQDADEKETNYQTAKAATKAAEDKVHSAESQLTAAKAQAKAQLANVAVSETNIQAAVARRRQASSEQGFQKVVAPFAGIITERNIDTGTLITSGSDNSKTTLYRLARIDEVKVFVDVPQYAATGIRVGQAVEVLLKEFPARKFMGVVRRTSVALNAAARTLRVEIHIPNKNGPLVPGMYADVNISVARTAPTLLIPANALVMRAEGPQVVVASGDSVSYRKVQLGDDLGQQVEIVSGLTGSEAIVMNPADSLRDGMRVKIEHNQAM